MVLLAIFDAKYYFTFVNFRQYGSANDISIFRNSGLYKAFNKNKFNVPAPTEAEGFEDPLPYFLLGDEIFSLKTWLMRSFPGSLDDSQKIFHYRLSSARRTIENAFGILVARWQIFKRPIRASIETVQSISGACVCPHKYLQKIQSSSYTPQGFIDVEGFDGAIKEGDWRSIIKHDSALNRFTKVKGGKVSYDAKSCSVIFKSLLKFSGRVSGMTVGLYQKNRSIKKFIVFFITVIYIYH